MAACVTISACSNDNATNYCKNHDLFHNDHRDTLGNLVVNMKNTGLLVTDLTLPYSIFGYEPPDGAIVKLEETLRDSQNVYNLQTEHDCKYANVTLYRGTEAINVHYESSCGASNKIRQLNFTLFDTVPELNEIDVLVKTVAVSKRFVINRQCDSAIFRLD